MVRECATALAVCLLSGCSLILDFSSEGKPPIDAPFNDAECAFKEPNDTLATAATLGLGDVGPAAICSQTMGVDDRDFYKLTIPANMSVSAKITFVNSATGDLDLKLTDAQGTTLSSSRGFDNDEQIVCPGASPPCAGPLAAGDYILEVFPANPGMANRYDIALSLTP
ncbi:MAG: pre-peptidase C-terminal domain-containing protein [Myxococcota bacterium]|nr:pre-peptidase C-terminal domain-containing protein [Myxococcota bacterium]